MAHDALLAIVSFELDDVVLRLSDVELGAVDRDEVIAAADIHVVAASDFRSRLLIHACSICHMDRLAV